MKHLFCTLFIYLSVLVTTAHAQMMQFHIGGPGNEIATRVRYNPTDQSVIIAGYTYDYSGSAASNCQAIVMKIYFGGDIAWQKTFGVPLKNNLIQDMIITEDGNIVVVGTVGGSGAVFADNTAAILKFNSTNGELMWQKCLRNATTTTGGELFFGVTELRDGTRRLVAVGGHNFTGSGAGSMFCVFDSTGNFIYNEVFDVPNGDELVGVTTNSAGNGVYACGLFVGTFKDGRVISYTPGATSGTINWSKYYNFNLMGTLSNNFFNSIFLTEDSSLIISGGCLNGYSTAGGSGHFVLTMKEDGSSPAFRGIQNSGAAHANSPRIAPVTKDHIFTIQSPSSAYYDPTLHVSGASTSTVVNEITSLSTSTSNDPVVFKSAEVGLHSFLDMRYEGSYIYLAGATNVPSGYGNNDIYYVLTAPTLSSLNANCDTMHTTLSITAPTYNSTTPTFTTTQFVPVYSTVDTGTTNFSIGQLCGDGDVPPPPPPTRVTTNAATVFNIFPNPFDDILTITGEKIEAVTVTNLMGQVVYNMRPSANAGLQQVSINTAGFAKGMYFVRVNDKMVQKIVK